MSVDADCRDPATASFIPAAHAAHTVPPSLQCACQPQHKRGFPRPADSEIADTNDVNRQSFAWQEPEIVENITTSDQDGESQRERDERCPTQLAAQTLTVPNCVGERVDQCPSLFSM